MIILKLSVQLHKFREELRNRSRVLKRLGHINADGVVQLKGRAACFIDTADELLVTELMFNGIYVDLKRIYVQKLGKFRNTPVFSIFPQMHLIFLFFP